jgi:glycosyltransferase involved in cell wall biosynthesis
MISSFSVIVPVFNKQDAIIRTLESIETAIAYFFDHFEAPPSIQPEVIVLNDGSRDRSLDLIADFARPRPYYKIISHFRSLGAGPARNTAAKISMGDILFFCDGDDLFLAPHIYLCFRILNHAPHPERPQSASSFQLVTDVSSYTVELPNYPIGAVRTGVYLKEPVHPQRKLAIENTLSLNLCVRRECHDFVEGFPEAPIYKELRGYEDGPYSLWLSRFFKLVKVNLDTVEYVRYPGNNFDRQLARYQVPPETYQDTVSSEERELHAVRTKLEHEKLTYLMDKFRRAEISSKCVPALKWRQPPARKDNMS